MKRNPALSDVRERIVETASRLFYQQGYNLTGINQVIAESGVAKASLYQHFLSKDDLLQEYLLRAGRQWSEALRDKAALLENPKEKVLVAFDLFGEFTKCADYRGCNFQNIVSEVPTSNARITEIVQNQKNVNRTFFKEHLAAAGKPELADEIFVLFEGACIVSQMYGNLWALETARNFAGRLL